MKEKNEKKIMPLGNEIITRGPRDKVSASIVFGRSSGLKEAIIQI